MSSSCSEDDSDAGRIVSTQYDDDLDLDAQRRQRREAAAKQRQQQIENRRKERERQAEERREKLAQSKRRKRPANDSSDDDSAAGSTDLLADKSPVPSPPSSPSPPRNRISNNNNNNNNNNNRKLNNASPLTSASAKVNSASNNNKTSSGGGIGIVESDRKPAVKWKPKYYDSSDDDNNEQDKFRSSRDNNTFRNNGTGIATAATSNNNTSMNGNSSNGSTIKVTSERAKLNAKVAAQNRFGNQSDSDDSSDDGGFEAMRKAMRIKKEREAARKATADKSRDSSSSPSIPSPEDRKMSSYNNTTSTAGNSNNNNRPSFAPSSPDTMDVDDSPRIKRPTSRGGGVTKSLAQLAQNLQSDSDSDDDGNDMAKLFRERKAKKEAEERVKKEAARRHNPMALEKHEREQREYLNAQNAEDRKRLSPKKPEKSLEGTEIVLGDDDADDVRSELGLSQSDMGDDTPNKGGKGGDGFISTKPSRGMYKRRGSAKDGDDSDISDTPNKKKQRSNGAMQDSFDDGLWDDPTSDQDVRMKMNNSDSDSDNAGAKNKRGRGRKRANNGTTQPRKRSRSTKAAADSDDDDSDAPAAAARQKKKAPSKKTTRRRRSNSDSDDEPRKRGGGGGGGEMPWASRYGIDEDEKSDVSEDERELRERQLKPDFANPKLGPPGPLVPFVLSKTWRRGDALIGAEDDAIDDDEDKKMPAAPDSDADQVPASINRYLKDYQREGVQFIYSSVIKGKGCILGDDMGLGKTVQMISLIAALLKKTGTGLDLLDINQHGNKVKKALQAREESKHQALLTGFGIKNDADALETIEAPRFTPILIIVPSSVVENWQNEFKTWGHFNVGVYAGSNREKALDRIKDGLDFILITGKSLFTRAGDYDELAQVEWKVVIVDEYHEFKNGKSQAFKRLEDLRNKCGCPIVGMTGTLMQNKHDELFFLIDLVRPGLIGSKEAFRSEISRPITYARAKDAKQQVLDLADEREQILRNAIRPAFLERKKEVVLKDELTEKKEEVIFCELTDIQKKIYRHMIALPDYQQLRFARAPCDCGVNKQYFRGYKKMKTHREQLDYQRRNKGILTLKKECCYKYPWNPLREEPDEPQIDPDAILWKQAHEKEIGCPVDIAQNVIDGKYVTCQNCPTCTTLVAMTKLYKISSHPNLLQVDRLESAATQKKKLEFAKVALPQEILKEMPGGSYYKSDGIMDDHMKLSGKMRTLDYCLTKFLKRRNRVLVFSYSTAALDVIQNHIKCKGWSNMRLDGKTPTNQRQGLVDKFQIGDTQVFLISTKAGGLGLNLTAANKVIIFDVNWNPSYDEQAQDRAFRIGQKKNVQIVRLVARGTIEELMYARQVYKVQLKKQTLGHNTDGKNQPQLFRGVANDNNRKGELFGLENLLKFKDGSFMASLWKAKDDPNETHDLADLANELENMDEDKLDDIAEEGDEGPKDTRKSSKKKKSNGKYDSSDDDDESDDDDFKGEGGKINHDHLFAQSNGGAQVAQGDDDFDEEMGGESQIIEVTTKMACEEIGSDDEDEEEEEEEDDNAATPEDYVPPCKKNEDVKPVVKSEPVKSSKPEATTSLNPDVNAASAPSPVKSSNAAGTASSSTALVPSPVQSSSVNATPSNKTSANNEEGDDDDKTAPVPTPQPSPVQSSAAKGDEGKISTTANDSDDDDDKTAPIPPHQSNSANVATTNKTSTKNGESDDDKTVPVPQPSPVQSSAAAIGGGDEAAIGNGSATSQSKATAPKNSSNPDSSDDDMSPGLKTQPPTTVKKKKKKASKVAILGSVFETKKDSGKKSTGIYVPSYKK